ncbi:MAG: D-aminoacyl-tRNA deacylase [Candidatus Thorarchaeota archaeon]
MRVLVTSERDIASLNIKDILLNEYGFEVTGQSFEGNPIYRCDESTLLVTAKDDLIYCNHLEAHFQPDAFIFCSRHRAESGKPALLVHSTGNFGSDAQFGGNPHELSVSAGSLITAALQTLYEKRNESGLIEFDVSLEVTHHGPTSMATPLLFIELGSDEHHWRNKEGARVVAAAAMDAARVPTDNFTSIGFGGTHYASKFNRLVLERDIRIGHIAPKYALDEIKHEVVHQMISRSKESVKQAIIDWKGTNSTQKAHLFPILEALDIEIIRAKNV